MKPTRICKYNENGYCVDTCNVVTCKFRSDQQFRVKGERPVMRSHKPKKYKVA